MISFVLDGELRSIDFRRNTSGLQPTTTVLNYLRSLPSHKGVKEGCAEGDCGACTVVLGENHNGKIRYRHVDSCLLFLPMIHRRHLVTVENLRNQRGELHPVQRSMVETNGSQCGYCTPGIIMSLFSLYKNTHKPGREEIDDALTGNLCRCTGYKPIIEAAAQACVSGGLDQFDAQEQDMVRLLSSIPDGSLHLQTDKQHYYRPASISEALGLRREHPEAVLISGATDIALRVTKNHEFLKKIIDVSAVERLTRIQPSTNSLAIGSAVTLTDAMPYLKADFPALSDILTVFGSQQIRNLATFGGNLGTASPIGDTLPVLMAYNANVTLESLSGKREVALDDFFMGYRKTACQSDELITGLVLPIPHKAAAVRSYKISKRKDLDISTVSAGFNIQVSGGKTVESVRLAFGGMAEKTKRATTVEQFLKGRKWDRQTVEEATRLIDVDFKPISDVRGSAEMRKVAAKNLLLKFWNETHEVSTARIS